MEAQMINKQGLQQLTKVWTKQIHKLSWAVSFCHDIEHKHQKIAIICVSLLICKQKLTAQHIWEERANVNENLTQSGASIKFSMKIMKRTHLEMSVSF